MYFPHPSKLLFTYLSASGHLFALDTQSEAVIFFLEGQVVGATSLYIWMARVALYDGPNLAGHWKMGRFNSLLYKSFSMGVRLSQDAGNVNLSSANEWYMPLEYIPTNLNSALLCFILFGLYYGFLVSLCDLFTCILQSCFIGTGNRSILNPKKR